MEAWTMLQSGIWPHNKGQTEFTIWYRMNGDKPEIKIDAKGGDILVGQTGKETRIKDGKSLILSYEEVVILGRP